MAPPLYPPVLEQTFYYFAFLITTGEECLHQEDLITRRARAGLLSMLASHQEIEIRQNNQNGGSRKPSPRLPDQQRRLGTLSGAYFGGPRGWVQKLAKFWQGKADICARGTGSCIKEQVCIIRWRGHPVTLESIALTATGFDRAPGTRALTPGTLNLAWHTQEICLASPHTQDGKTQRLPDFQFCTSFAWQLRSYS
eukprot:1156266-Pelagomonas_calceolata.AAC.2